MPQRKENKTPPPIVPPLAGGDGKKEDIFSCSIVQLRPPKDGIERNFQGLLSTMGELGIPEPESVQIAKLSNYGQIGHPVWKLILQCRNSQAKSVNDPTRIKSPAKFILRALLQGNNL